MAQQHARRPRIVPAGAGRLGVDTWPTSINGQRRPWSAVEGKLRLAPYEGSVKASVDGRRAPCLVGRVSHWQMIGGLGETIAES